MARQQIKSHITILLLLSLTSRHLTSQHCGTDLYSVYQMMLNGHTFKTLKIKPDSLECREACLADVRCQSYNVMVRGICELNNRTKEARPEDFVKDLERYYMKSSTRVPLGSIPELSGDSCKEIKESEGGQAVSGNYWLDSTRSGNSMLARCDMKTEVADYCIKHQCQNNAVCVNGHVNYTCACTSSGWTLPYCEKDIDECTEGTHDCHSNAKCQNTEGSYICSCKSGFQGDGKNICSDIDECTEGTHDCHSNAKCQNSEGSYICSCKSGFHGDGKNICSDIDECIEGTHDCHSNAKCQNRKGSYICSCKPGFQGDGINICSDINECVEGSHGCHQDATCLNTAGSYKCTCNSEYIGNGLNCEPKECSDYKTLTSARRNKSYKSSKPYICDDELDEKWYRFNGPAGTKMPTSCVAFKSCAGQRPGWLSGGHPTKADGRVSRTVYFRSFDDCKVKSKTIQVRNCGSYYVYHLRAVKDGPNCARFCST